MTDEEKLAEAYADSYGDDNHLDFGETQINLWPLRHASFLAGLEAGEKCGFERGVKVKVNTTTISDCPIKSVWHSVADGDFPKEYSRARTLGYYLTASKHASYKGLLFEVAYFTGVAFTKGGDILDNVIAWCEIPEYVEV